MKKPWSPDEWTFGVDEISPGLYEAIADDQQGGQIRHVGPDDEALHERCKQEAAELTQRRREAAAE